MVFLHKKLAYKPYKCYFCKSVEDLYKTAVAVPPMAYLPTGELFVDKKYKSYNSPYKFNGKEQDSETGYYYYGARYYNPKVSLWLNVDPLAEKTGAPYNYCYQNPVKLVDPDGMEPTDIVIRGRNNSSITIKTDLINVNVNAGSIIGDLGGNYTFHGNDILVTGLDIIGMVDPTPISDMLSAKLSLSNGNYWEAGASFLGAAIPYAGDAAKIPKIAKGLDKIHDAINSLKTERKAFGAGLDTASSTAKQAFNKAKDQNGIPRSQQPIKQYKVPDKNTGKPLHQYDYINSKGEKISIRKDNPIKYPDGGYQGPHYNAGKSGNKLKQHHDYKK